MGLIFTAILFLTIPGILFNNFNSSGLNPGFSLTCPGYPDVTCTNSAATGCQLDASSCTLQSNSISFLNQASPFTAIITGNWLAFIYALTNSGSNPNPESPFQITGLGTSNLYPGQCTAIYQGNATADSYYVIRNETDGTGGCSAVNSQGVPFTNPFQAPTLQPAPGSSYQVAIPIWYLGLTNGSEFPKTASAYIQSDSCNNILQTTSRVGSLANELLGCQWYSTINHKTTYWYYAVNINFTSNWVNNSQGGSRTIGYCLQNFGLNQTQCPNITVPLTIQPESWDIYDCAFQIQFQGGTTYHQDLGTGGVHFYNPNVMNPITPQCAALLASIDSYSRSNSPLSTTLAFGSIWLWIGGIILFIIGSGINFSISGDVFGTGGGMGAGVNRQGTKLAQVLGLALIGFTPLWSEFSSWFTSGILPNGFDGYTGITSILIAAMMFGGVFWQATQD
jgi:hypothetical protein